MSKTRSVAVTPDVTLFAPCCPWEHEGGGTPREIRHPKNNNPIIVSIFPRGAEFGAGGLSKPLRRTLIFSKNDNLLTNFVQNLFYFKLEPVAISEALGRTILILQMLSIVLAH